MKRLNYLYCHLLPPTTGPPLPPSTTGHHQTTTEPSPFAAGPLVAPSSLNHHRLLSRHWTTVCHRQTPTLYHRTIVGRCRNTALYHLTITSHRPLPLAFVGQSRVFLKMNKIFPAIQYVYQMLQKHMPGKTIPGSNLLPNAPYILSSLPVH